MKKFPYKLVISIGIGIAVILGIYNLYILVNPKIRTQIATTGTIEEYISAEGTPLKTASTPPYLIKKEDSEK